jgi:hypothetical protein
MMNIQRVQANDVGKALTLARKNHWWFRVIGTGSMISSPKYQDGWWLVPINEDKTIIPKNALQRVEKLKQDGIRIQGVIVAHEAPKLLCAPAKEPFKIDTEAISKTVGEVAAVLARILATMFGILFYMMAAGILVDPALIVVLEDGTNLEVMSWYEA